MSQLHQCTTLRSSQSCNANPRISSISRGQSLVATYPSTLFQNAGNKLPLTIAKVDNSWTRLNEYHLKYAIDWLSIDSSTKDIHGWTPSMNERFFKMDKQLSFPQVLCLSSSKNVISIKINVFLTRRFAPRITDLSMASFV